MKKILICDDEFIIREFIETLLEDEIDAEFTHAENGNIAVDILGKEKDFDLIICDMNMPVANGDIVHEFNQEHEKSPFIFLSGHDHDFTSSFTNFNKENKCSVVTKPWEEDVLIDTVKEFLAS